MRWLLKVLGGLLLLIILVVLGLFGAARLHDGPLDGGLAIIAGGPFESGDQHTGPEPDWQFLKDYATVEFQLLDPARSRTTWIMEHDNRIYIPSGYMTTFVGKLWKHWPLEAEQDGRALLRVDGKLYPRTLVRITEGPQLEPVLAELSRKYMGGEAVPPEAVSSGYLWIFELVPREP
jgi:hypothetical protein